MTTATAWPFLVARGRRRGYTVLAAPGFLVRAGEEGFLEDIVGPGPVTTRTARTPSGRDVYLVWADHRVRGAEIGEPADPVDEHSRPLRLLHGFVCPEAVVAEPDPADLDRTLDAALGAYRRFLRDEEAFTVEESAPFPVRAGAVVAPAAAPPRRIRTPALLVAAGLVAVLVVLLGLWFTVGQEPPPGDPCPTVTTPDPPLLDTSQPCDIEDR